jgi:hypothetical protein
MKPSEIGLNTTPYEIISQNLSLRFIADPVNIDVGEVAIELASLYPAVGELRTIMALMLQDCLNQLYITQNSQGACNSSKADPVEVALAISNLIGSLRDSGLVRNEEIGDIILNRPLQKINAAEKYITWEELVEMSDDLIDVEWCPGLIHGGLRPPHPGHTRLIRKVSAISHPTIVGFDPSWERRRVKKDNAIPFRIPLAAAMHQVASTPFVDHVFVLPICGLTDEERDEEMSCIYRRLSIRALGVGSDNPLLPKFQGRMRNLGIIVQDDLSRIHSSTEIMQIHHLHSRYDDLRPITDHFRLFISHIDTRARMEGFLRDFPDQTELYDRDRVLKRLRATNTI